MSEENIAKVIKMIEYLPDAQQARVIEHLREYIADIEDELNWDHSFEKTQDKLVAAARLAQQEIAEGKEEQMDYEKL